MVVFLFWNIRNRDLKDMITKVVHKNNVDVLILAESTLDSEELLNKLNFKQEALYSLTWGGVKQLQVYTRYPREFIQPIKDSVYISIRNIALPLRKEILLVGAHLPSKLFESRDDQTLECTRIIEEIEKAEESVGHSQTILVGDLNMNPFETGIVGAAGFHGTMDRRIAKKGSRKVKGEEYRFFYNPMWGKFGDEGKKPPGTYYYASGTHTCLFWNIYDQVLVRPELIDLFKNENLEILTNVGSISLLKKSGRPDVNVGSDHLPILFKVDI